MTKQDELLFWCRWKKEFSRVHVIQWGLDNHYIRSDRTVRDFVSDGKVRRLSEDEVLLRGLRQSNQAKVSWYESI